MEVSGFKCLIVTHRTIALLPASAHSCSVSRTHRPYESYDHANRPRPLDVQKLLHAVQFPVIVNYLHVDTWHGNWPVRDFLLFLMATVLAIVMHEAHRMLG